MWHSPMGGTVAQEISIIQMNERLLDGSGIVDKNSRNLRGFWATPENYFFIFKIYFIFIFLFFKVYFERGKERREGQGDRGRQKESQRICAVSMEPHMGLDVTNRKIMARAETKGHLTD